MGGMFYQIKRRVEPLSSLYVDLGITGPEMEETVAPSLPATGAAAIAPKTAEQVAENTKRGAIVQQTKKKSFKVSGV
jgi:hypothetical protein